MMASTTFPVSSTPSKTSCGDINQSPSILRPLPQETTEKVTCIRTEAACFFSTGQKLVHENWSETKMLYEVKVVWLWLQVQSKGAKLLLP